MQAECDGQPKPKQPEHGTDERAEFLFNSVSARSTVLGSVISLTRSVHDCKDAQQNCEDWKLRQQISYWEHPSRNEFPTVEVTVQQPSRVFDSKISWQQPTNPTSQIDSDSL